MGYNDSSTSPISSPDSSSYYQSPLSVSDLCGDNVNSDSQMHIDKDDPDVQLAAEALGSMARGFPNTSTGTSPKDSGLAGSTSTGRESDVRQDPLSPPPQRFMSRVSSLPLVNSAIKVYEQGKASNRVLNYGAGLVESSVKTIAAPLYGTIGKHIEDRYAFNKAAELKREEEDEAATAAAIALARASLQDTDTRKDLRRRKHRDSDDEDFDMDQSTKSRSRTTSRSASPARRNPHQNIALTPIVRRQEQVSRSRWQQLVVGAGSAAGTTVAIVSEESMRCLKYCLSWLQYAIKHIEQQMGFLKAFLVSLASSKNTNSKDGKQSTAVVAQTDASKLEAIKKEVIDTLRKVVEVISKYAGSSLPEQARSSVRGFILSLPNRWASVNQSAANSPTLGPQSDSHAQETAIKLMTFGNESVEMLNGVAGVFGDTVDRAELWLDRLRGVGVVQPKVESSQHEAKKRKNKEQDIIAPPVMQSSSNQDIGKTK
ncbi:transcriptional regulator opi1 [Umbelopsis sp. WA50703]